ncbi:UNVERIFIED_CONTAM: hypothetical protein FKN15_069399 [Acipenser sinensis]
MGKKSRQRQQQKQQQQQLPPPPQPLWEDPASLFPWCSWCGKEDHWWRPCPDGPPADWCGRCEADGHSWAGCPHNPDQEQLQTSSSAATPPLPTSPPSPPSQEIWDWLMHPEADLFHDLLIVINTLWRRDGGGGKSGRNSITRILKPCENLVDYRGEGTQNYPLSLGREPRGSERKPTAAA